MSTTYTIKYKVTFAEGFEREGETWEDRLEEAHDVRELFHEIFGKMVPPNGLDEIELDEEKRAPIEYEIDGVKACCFGMELEQYSRDVYFDTKLFGALKELPPGFSPLQAMEWEKRSWAEDFCRQRRCWLDYEYWNCESFVCRHIVSPLGENISELPPRSERSLEDFISENRSACILKLTTIGEQPVRQAT